MNYPFNTICRNKHFKCSYTHCNEISDHHTEIAHMLPSKLSAKDFKSCWFTDWLKQHSLYLCRCIFIESLINVCFCFVFSIRIEFPWYRKSCAARTLCFTLPRSEPIDWTNLFRILQHIDLDALTSVIYSLSKLKKVELSVDSLNESLSVWTLSISRNCPSLTELK